jgi:diguanylate cyclase (GGDEF)-like protein
MPPVPIPSEAAPAARRTLLRLSAVAALALAAPGASAQDQRYAIASWGTEQGLPSNIALNICQTRDGYLWVATYQGLVRFDGVTFRTFSEADIPGLVRASFWRVAADSAGALWAASETDGVVRYSGGQWTIFRTGDGLKSDKVTTVLPDARGVWVGTRGGVSRFERGRMHRLPAPPWGEPSVTDLALDAEGNLWIGTVSDGLVRYRDGHYARVGEAEGLSDNRVTSLRADRDHSVWVGTYDAGITQIRGGRLRRLAADGLEAPRRVNDFVRDTEGMLWVAADNGLFRIAGETAVPVPLPNGRPLTQASSLHLDPEGSLWVGSRQGGLFRVRPASVMTLTSRDGLPNDLVSSIIGDGAGGVWIATHGGVVHRDSAGGATRFTQASGHLRDNIARDVLRARNGDVWVATNGGLTRIRGRETVTYTAADGLPDHRARALWEGADGTLWVATYNGLAAFRDGVIRAYGERDGLGDPYVLSVFEDSRGTLWVGTQSEGLYRREGGRFVPGPTALARQPVFRVMEDADGTIWVGTALGLARIRGSRTFVFDSRHGLPGNPVFQALDDGAGRLWLTAPWGVGHVRRDELEAVAAGRARIATVKQFGSRDGMAAREASSISRAWRGPDGTLWFPTPAGVALIQPARLRSNPRPPNTLVERVVVDATEFSATTPVRLDPGARRLEFHYTGTSFVAPEQLRFRYRLDPFDSDWVDGGTRRVAYYTSLAPGAYTFRVQARNEDGVWSQGAASVSVRLRPYFWETWWFAVLAALAMALLGYGAHRLRLRIAQQALREQMLRDLSLHDDLTGLYNRRGLMALGEQQVRAAERQRRGFDVVFVDLDGLKGINDQHGHPAGDQALIDCARLLRETFRESDVMARLGGDEFALLVLDDPLVHGGQPGIGVDQACQRLLDAVEELNASEIRPYTLSLSVGCSGFDPAQPVPLERLLADADQRMYTHKRQKRLARA